LKYLNELNEITIRFNFFKPAPNPNDSIKLSYDSNFYSEEFDPHPSSVMNKEELKKILFKTPLLDDQYHTLQKKENGKEIKLTIDVNKCKFASGSFSQFKNNTFVQGDIFQGMKLKKEDSLEQTEDKEIIEEEEWEKVRILKHYRAITEQIEKDLKDIQSNVFAHLKQQFISYFCNKYEKLLCAEKKYAQINEKNKGEYVKKVEQAFVELKQFIRVLEECLCLFYKLQDFKNTLSYFLFTKENMLNFITSIVFDDNIYPLVFEIQRKIDKSMSETIEKKLVNYQTYKPQDFDISEKFCLNERTANYIFLKRKAEYLEKLHNSNENKFDDTTTFSLENMILGRASTVNNPNNEKAFDNSNESLYDEETFKLTHYEPYLAAIKNLKKIGNHKSPLHKLKHIMNISKLVLQEIRDFYECHYLNFDDNLGGDEMLSIYVYIVAKTNLPGLITECTIIDKFITSNLTNSIYGYYLVTIQVCLKYLINCKGRMSDEEKVNSSKLVLKEMMESYDDLN